jgi:hypothetical protein
MGADNTNSTQYSNTLAPCSNNGTICIWSSVTDASPEANDTLTMCKIPAGYRVVAYALSASAKIGDSGAVTIGTYDGTTLDADSIATTIAITAATTSAGPSLTPANTVFTTANGYVLITVTGVGANPTTDTVIRLVVWCTPFSV